MTIRLHSLYFMVIAVWLMAAGCANTKAAASALAHGMVDSACVIGHKSVDLAFGPIQDVYTDAGVMYEGAKGLAK